MTLNPGKHCNRSAIPASAKPEHSSNYNGQNKVCHGHPEQTSMVTINVRVPDMESTSAKKFIDKGAGHKGIQITQKPVLVITGKIYKE
jgi:hypothetical protein